jgi:hypothetical protein
MKINILHIIFGLLILSSFSFAWLNQSYNQVYRIPICNPNNYTLGNSTDPFRTWLDIPNTSMINYTNGTDILPYLNSTGAILQFNDSNLTLVGGNAAYGRIYIALFGFPAATCDQVDIYHNSTSATNWSNVSGFPQNRSLLNWANISVSSGSMQGTGASYNGSVLCAVNASWVGYYSTNYGETWTDASLRLAPPATLPSSSIKLALDCAVSGDGNYIAYAFGGSNISYNITILNLSASTRYVSNTTGEFYSVAESDNGSVIVACEHSGSQRCLRSQNYGRNFTQVDSGLPYDQVGISQNGTYISVAVLGANAVRNSNDGGATWNTRSVGGNVLSAAVSYSGKTQYSGGTVGNRSDDYGVSYNRGIGAFSGTRGMATTYDGGIITEADNNAYISYDSGNTWTFIGYTIGASFGTKISRDGRVIVATNQTSEDIVFQWDIRQLNNITHNALPNLCIQQSINYTIKDLITGNLVNATFVNMYSTLSSYNSGTTTGTNTNYSICLNETNSSYNMTTTESYSASGYFPLTNSRILNASNITQNIVVYMLNSSVGTPVLITVITANLDVVPDVYVNISESAGNFVSSKTTNTLGQTVEYLRPVTTLYDFVVYDSNGIVLLNLTNTPVCTTQQPCSQSLIIRVQPPTNYFTTNQINDYCSFDNSTFILNCTFGNASLNKTLILQNWTLFGGEIIGTNSTITNSSVSILVPNVTGQYYYQFYIQNSQNASNVAPNLYIKVLDSNYINVNPPIPNRFNTDGWFLAFLLIMTLGFIGFSFGVSPGILMMDLGIILSVALQLITLGIPSIIGASVFTGALIYRVGQTRRE